MSKLVLYHGSTKIIQKPKFGLGKTNNDYGLGFYCTENLELAKEWACTEEIDGFSNKYEIETEGLSILNLHDEKFTMMNWLALLVQNRTFDLSTPIMKQGVYALKNEFLIDTSDYDLIYGWRADDSYFTFTKLFLTNQISYSQLQFAMKLGNLGNQYMIKSQKAFDLLKFVEYEKADKKVYFQKKQSRLFQAKNDLQKSLESDDLNGIFMLNVVRGEVKNDDSRLR